MGERLNLVAAGLLSSCMVIAPVASNAGAYDGCTCVTAPVSKAASLGSVSNPGPGVQISGANGFQSAADGDAIGDGTELTIGAGGGGSASIGEKCNVSLKPFRLVSVSMPEGDQGKICVKVADLTPKGGAPAEGAASSGAGFKPVVVGLGVAVAGGLALLLIGGGGNPASP